MKKKLSILLALAAFAGATSVAIGCGDTDSEKPEHTHHLVWENTNETQHWQYCDLEGCDYVGEKTGHVDGKDANGEAGFDGVCDDCGYVIVAPHDHTTELTSDDEAHWNYCTVDKCQYVEVKELHVDEIDNDTEEEGKDAKCDTCGHDIPVGHKANPAPLTLDTQRLLAIKKDGKLYYEFTAEADGRYTIKLANGANSRKCQFTTTIEGDVWYGSDCLAAEEHLDIEAGDTVTIILTCPVELEDGATVSVLVTETTDEPLPADKYIDGEYTDWQTTVVIDRENAKISLDGVEYAYRYVGSTVDTLYFTQGTTVYSLKYVEDGKYDLTYVQSNGGSTTTKHLVYLESQAPIAVAKFSGKYVPAAGGELNNITEVIIYESGNGYYTNYANGASGREYYKNEWELGENSAEYVQKYNKLRFGIYTVTLNLNADGDAESITIIKNGDLDSATVYTRDSDSGVELPKRLNIAVGEYGGDNMHTLVRFMEGHSTLDGEVVNITGYDSANEIYTVTAYALSGGKYQECTFKIEVVDDVTLKLYDANDAPLDTLVRYAPHFADITNGAHTFATADVQKNLYLYKAKEEGWYKVEWDSENEQLASLGVYYNIGEDTLPNAIYWGSPAIKAENGEAIYFEKGDILGVYFGEYYGEGIPENVTITFTETTAPAGRTQNNPIVLEGGTASIGNVNGTDVYYFKFIAPKAGSYLVNISSVDDWGGESYNMHYVMKNEHYGYDPATWQWSGISAQDPYASITLAEGEELIIAADRASGYATATLNVTVIDDYASAATDIDAANVTSGTLENGVYKVTSFSGENKILGITLTSEADMEVTVLGVTTTTKKITLTEAQLKKGFKLECSGEVSYASACAVVYVGECEIDDFWGGVETTPVTLTVATDGSIAIYEVNYEEYVVFPTLTDGQYVFTYNGFEVSFTFGDETISIDDELIGTGTLTVKADSGEEGDGITYSSEIITFVFSKELADMELNETSTATYQDNFGAGTVTITKTGDNEYSYFGSAYGEVISGTITLGDGYLDVNDDYYGPMSLNRQ